MSKNTSKELGYAVDQKFYKFNPKTNDIEEFVIEDILFKFDRKIRGKQNLSAYEIDELVNEGFFSKDTESVKEEAIRQLEKKFNIKLKEEK